MVTQEHEILPGEIRAIRERLGLTQVEAGKLLGGGPRAFTKYEAGTVKPAAGVANLLRVLQTYPDAITALGGDPPRRGTPYGPLPFEISGEDVERLSQLKVHDELLRKLLHAEAHANDLPADGIHVSSRTNDPDGGEDGRIEWTGRSIEWTGGRDRTSYLPARRCQFQLKAGPIEPKEAGSQAIKPMVRQFLESGGCYIMLCGKRYVQQLIGRRKAAISKALREAGMKIKDRQIDFRDADQIADWANSLAPVALWIKEQTQPGTVGPFRSWSYWHGRAEHIRSPLVDDGRLAELRTWLHERVQQEGSVARVVGLWGIGKSRLALEALGTGAGCLTDLVMYAVESESGAGAINQVAQNLAAMGTRAIVVVDQCRPQTHRILTGMVSRSESRLSLVTIDDALVTRALDETTFMVPEASPAVTEDIVRHSLPRLNPEDERRIVQFSTGFPEITIRIRETWGGSSPIANATEDDLVDAFVLGHDEHDRDARRGAAALLAALGAVRPEPVADTDLAEIAKLGLHLDADDLYRSFQDLIGRGVAQRRGRYISLRPLPIAMRLAEHQWKEWSTTQWEEVLAGDISAELKVSAARQLALLNDTQIAKEVVNHVCRNARVFDGVDVISENRQAEMLASLAEVDTAAVAEVIERYLNEVDDPSDIRAEVGNHLVRALEKVAFDSRTFDEGAQLLLRLAVFQHEVWLRPPTCQFTQLFPVGLGNTEADGKARLSLLDETLATDDPIQLETVVSALAAGSRTSRFSRQAGAETYGSRPALKPWWPPTRTELNDYVEGCVTRLGVLAERDDAAGAAARSGLAESLRSLVQEGFIDIAERAVRRVATNTGPWPEAIEFLGRALRPTRGGVTLPSDVAERVQRLITELQPQSLESRVRFLVTEMPWDYPYDAAIDHETKYRRKVEALRSLVRELVEQPSILRDVLPQLSQGHHRMSHVFGEELAVATASAQEWLERIIGVVMAAPDATRDFELLSGYLAGIAPRHPELVDASLYRVAHSRELAPALPQLYRRLGVKRRITASNIGLLIGALGEGLLPPQGFGQGFFGAVLEAVPPATVAPLLDAMIEHSADAFAEAIAMIGTYTSAATEKLEELRPQVRKLAESVTQWSLISESEVQCGDFGEIMTWMLGKGREDPDARTTALALAKALVDAKDDGHDDLLEPVVPVLLSSFPEIVWPLVGQAIVSGEQRSWRLETVLMNPYGNEHESALLKLPEETLLAWCHAHPDRAPAFAVRCLPVVREIHHVGNASVRAELHPVMARLIDDFGDSADVLEAIAVNMHNFLCFGSAADYLERYNDLLDALSGHPIPRVRRWAKKLRRQHGDGIKNIRESADERALRAQTS